MRTRALLAALAKKPSASRNPRRGAATSGSSHGRMLGARSAAIVLAGAALVGLMLVAAGCGGSSDPKVAQVSTSSGANGPGSSSASGDPQAFSACMRRHGVPSFPDPDSSGRIQIPSTIDDRSATVRAAYRACRDLAPSEGSVTGQGDTMQQDELLAFARCMRAHGVPAFPDPQVVNGHIRMRVTAGQIDPNSPVVTSAMAACRSKLGGRSSASSAQKLVEGAAGPPQGKKGE
jgi:hypothetical protein